VEGTRGLPPRPRLTTKEIPAMPMGHISEALCLAAVCCSPRAHPPEAWRPRARRRPARELWRLADPVRAPEATPPGLRPQTTPAGIRRAGRRGMAFSSPGTPRAANPVIPSLRARLKPLEPVATIPTRDRHQIPLPHVGTRWWPPRRRAPQAMPGGRRHDASRLTSKPKAWMPRRANDAQ
jgi:hypothetical protein